MIIIASKDSSCEGISWLVFLLESRENLSLLFQDPEASCIPLDPASQKLDIQHLFPLASPSFHSLSWTLMPPSCKPSGNIGCTRVISHLKSPTVVIFTKLSIP